MPENLQHIPQQIKTLIAQLSAQQKVSLVALALVVLVSFAWLIAGRSSDEMVPLQWGARFDRDSLRQAEQTLVDQDLHEFKTVGETILVKQELVESYNAALASGGIWSAQAVDEWKKMFDDINIFTPREQLEEMRNAHLRREIRRVLSAIDSIQDADVIWAESSSLSRWNRTSVTCSVAVTTRSKQRLTPALIESLQTTVASMIPNLDSKGVVIFDRRTGESWSGGEASVAQLRCLAKRQSMIDGLQNKIQAALKYVPDTIVSASIEFEPVPEIVQASNDQQATAETHTADGAPKLNAQSTGPKNSTTPSSLHVTVSIPDEYIERVANARKRRASSHETKTQNATSEDVKETQSVELAKVKNICARLLPGGFNGDNVTVTSYTPLTDDADHATTVSDSRDAVISSGVAAGLFAVLGMWWWIRRASLRRAPNVANSHSSPTTGMSTANATMALPETTATAPPAIESPETLDSDISEPLESLIETQEQSEPDVVTIARPSKLPFDFLIGSSADEVYFLLADENPQTIAIVLSHVSTQMATDVLSSFPEKEQLDIVRRIANSAGSNCEFLDELAESLEEKSQDGQKLRSLRAGPENSFQHSLNGNHAPQVASSISAWRINTLDQLADLDSTVLATLVRKIPRDEFAIAITGLTHEKRSQILLHLPHHVSQEVRAHHAQQGPMDRAEIEQAQQRVLKRLGLSPAGPSPIDHTNHEFVA